MQQARPMNPRCGGSASRQRLVDLRVISYVKFWRWLFLKPLVIRSASEPLLWFPIGSLVPLAEPKKPADG